MLCWIPIVGDLLIMMGQHDRSEASFYYFRLEDQVPENRLLGLIEKHISFEFVREQLRESYSEARRPSIDPELLPRILLIGYLYGCVCRAERHFDRAQVLPYMVSERRAPMNGMRTQPSRQLLRRAPAKAHLG